MKPEKDVQQQQQQQQQMQQGSNNGSGGSNNNAMMGGGLPNGVGGLLLSQQQQQQQTPPQQQQESSERLRHLLTKSQSMGGLGGLSDDEKVGVRTTLTRNELISNTLQYFKPEGSDDEKLGGGGFKMGGQSGGMTMFGPMGSIGRGGPNSSLLHKAGNSQNPMLLKVNNTN